MEPNDRELEPAERAAVLAEWERLRAEPPPVSPKPYGCATFLVAAALLLIIPQLTKLVDVRLPRPWGSILLGILVLAMAGGFFVGVFFGSGVYGRAVVRARAALDWLAAHPDAADAAERRRNAVTLLYYALVSDGPTLAGTFDTAQARERLGASLPYVIAVERALRAERKVDPIFTGREDAPRNVDA